MLIKKEYFIPKVIGDQINYKKFLQTVFHLQIVVWKKLVFAKMDM